MRYPRKPGSSNKILNIRMMAEKEAETQDGVTPINSQTGEERKIRQELYEKRVRDEERMRIERKRNNDAITRGMIKKKPVGRA